MHSGNSPNSQLGETVINHGRENMARQITMIRETSEGVVKRVSPVRTRQPGLPGVVGKWGGGGGGWGVVWSTVITPVGAGKLCKAVILRGVTW